MSNEALASVLPKDTLRTFQQSETVIKQRTEWAGEKESQAFANAVHGLFGLDEVRGENDISYKPVVEITDSTTLGELKEPLLKVLNEGKNFYAAVKSKDRMIGERDEVLFDRALDFLEGKRRTSDSLINAVELLAAHEIVQAKLDFDTKFEEEWTKYEHRNGWLGPGVAVHGRFRLLRDFGGQEMLLGMEKRIGQAEKVSSFIKEKVMASAS